MSASERKKAPGTKIAIIGMDGRYLGRKSRIRSGGPRTVPPVAEPVDHDQPIGTREADEGAEQVVLEPQREGQDQNGGRNREGGDALAHQSVAAVGTQQREQV